MPEILIYFSQYVLIVYSKDFPPTFDILRAYPSNFPALVQPKCSLKVREKNMFHYLVEASMTVIPLQDEADAPLVQLANWHSFFTVGLLDRILPSMGTYTGMQKVRVNTQMPDYLFISVNMF